MIIVGLLDLPDGSDGKESACSAGDPGSIPGSGRFSVWRREWQPTPVFLPREFHGQRSLASYCPKRHKELDSTEATEHKLTLDDNVSKCHLLICKMEIITVPFSKPGEEFAIWPGT